MTRSDASEILKSTGSRLDIELLRADSSPTNVPPLDPIRDRKEEDILRPDDPKNRRYKKEKGQIEHDEREEEEPILDNIEFVKSFVELPYVKTDLGKTNNNEEGEEQRLQYKLTFDNHLILSFFLTKFKYAVYIKMDGIEESIPFTIKVLNFYKENTYSPIRVNHSIKPSLF